MMVVLFKVLNFTIYRVMQWKFTFANVFIFVFILILNVQLIKAQISCGCESVFTSLFTYTCANSIYIPKVVGPWLPTIRCGDGKHSVSWDFALERSPSQLDSKSDVKHWMYVGSELVSFSNVLLGEMYFSLLVENVWSLWFGLMSECKFFWASLCKIIGVI